MRGRFLPASMAVILLWVSWSRAADTAPPPPGAGVIYVVRHAEKDPAGGTDPGLSEAGRARAADLARTLRDAPIVGAISSQYVRTRETLLPVARAHGVDVTAIPASEAGAIAARAMERSARGAVVIAGHSNTVGKVLGALGVSPAPGDLNEADYDNLFMVTFCDGAPTLQRLHYGADDGVE